MLVSVTSSALLLLFSFLLIGLCVSRAHSCPERKAHQSPESIELYTVYSSAKEEGKEEGGKAQEHNIIFNEWPSNAME